MASMDRAHEQMHEEGAEPRPGHHYLAAQRLSSVFFSDLKDPTQKNIVWGTPEGGGTNYSGM